MKINSQDEYGLRILLRIASSDKEGGVSIPQLSEYEGLSTHYVAKLTRTLRVAGFIKSNRGHKGGYELAVPSKNIRISDVLKALGGTLFDDSFCSNHSNSNLLCTNSIDCSVRSLWQIIQQSLDKVLDDITLSDLISPEIKSQHGMEPILSSPSTE